MSEAVTFHRVESSLILKYTSGQEIDWIDDVFERNEPTLILKVFSMRSEDRFKGSYKLIDPYFSSNDFTIAFIFGRLEGEYYRIDKEHLSLKYDLLIQKEMKITRKLFIAYRGVSIFRKIDQISDQPIIVGGAHANAIPAEEFLALIASFPNSSELDRYSQSRISRILLPYLRSMTDGERKFEMYLKRRRPQDAVLRESMPLQRSHNRLENRNKVWFEFELKKFEFIRDQIKLMLTNYRAYSEKEWQNLILDFILVLFPKYIVCFDEFKVKDFYFRSDSRYTQRRIDFALIDANGNLDLIEIKRPFEDAILSKSRPRDNYVPHRELSQTIMQVEKYVFHLTKWGVEGEKEVNKKYSDQLPEGLSINFTNPKGLLILGRSNNFNRDQKFDFEIIKRKYSNIMDIITYDDLLFRLENLIQMFAKKAK